MRATLLQVLAAALGLTGWLKQVACADVPSAPKEDPTTTLQDGDAPYDHASRRVDVETGMEPKTNQNRMSIANMTCDFFEQPLNHFHVPREQSPSYQQRYCVYNGFVKESINRTKVPIFFYTGTCLKDL